MTNSLKVTLAVLRSLASATLFRKVFLILLAVFISYTAYSQTVYVTSTGEKYHDDGCRYLSRSKIQTTLKDAWENGYTACSVCKPTTKVSTGQQKVITTPAAPVKKATATQCSAKTKSKTRCLRKTTNSNGKCWQHQ